MPLKVSKHSLEKESGEWVSIKGLLMIDIYSNNKL